MFRIILFLVLIALAALGATWVADQTGTIVMSWDVWRIETTLPAFALGLGLLVVATLLVWSIVRGLWQAPRRIRRARRERRSRRGRDAITRGLLAIGHGDAAAARTHAKVARRLVSHEPLALLLHAQSAQLDGDADRAQRAFRAMAERADTRLLGLRGLFIEAQRADDPQAAVAIAEEALKVSPSSIWASQAALGFRCARGDWTGALAILEKNVASGLIDKALYRRQRGVLLTARALELEKSDRDASRNTVMEAVKYAPTLIPAVVLASKYLSEANQMRRAMRIIETAWLAQPHPDLADAYAHVMPGDSARERLARVETLAENASGHPESVMAIARAAIDASEFARAREVLEPLIAAPTQRVAMLMAEIEHNEHGDSGRARAWTLRAVRALHDPVWTADGYVSDHWRPVSPVTGRLDAFQWQAPLAALPSSRPALVEAEFSDQIAGDAPRFEALPAASQSAAQDGATVAVESSSSETVAASAEAATSPTFRTQSDPNKAEAASDIPAVIAIVRAPDDPGVDDSPQDDGFAEETSQVARQAGGLRGLLSRRGS
ncbi:heme biosynthesis HemY N-terminal domain-containing protein [Nitrobacter sp. NHB1]|uniref:heme biosynthesis HemY N-terminal domain-containing protein n=1 Tax=Nitrobacter sp. NHB1 TaxID=3119830 RepID=UPI002FFD65C2